MCIKPLTLAEEIELYDNMWDPNSKIQLHELKRYIPPSPSSTTKVDFKDCKKPFESLTQEIIRTINKRSFSKMRLSESLLWLMWTLENKDEYILLIASQADITPSNPNPVEEWTCVYKQLPTPSNSNQGIILISESQKFNSYEEILAELKKLNVITNIDNCY
jgi:hypothetical protein